MSAVRKLKPLDVAEYLAFEETSAIRHELVGGYPIAMVGTTQRHNLISGNLFAALRQHLRGKSCRVFMSDLRVRVGDNFYYPDLVVSCRPGKLNAKEVAQPVLIIEVLSESTEVRDRCEKRLAYQTLSSLREYLLVGQNNPFAEVYRRLPDGWEVETYEADERVRLASLEAEIPMTLVYEGLDDY